MFVVGRFLIRIDIGGSRDLHLDRKLHRIRLQLVNGNVGARDFFRKRGLQLRDYSGRRLLVRQLNQDLRVILLLLFRSHRKPAVHLRRRTS